MPMGRGCGLAGGGWCCSQILESARPGFRVCPCGCFSILFGFSCTSPGETRTPEIDLAICENPSRGQRLGRWETAIFYREKGVQNPNFPARAEPLLSPSGGLTGGCAFSLGSAFLFFF